MSVKSDETEDTIIVAGIACRVPGADNLDAFSSLLFEGRTGYQELPDERCDRELYFNPEKGRTGQSYTTLGGIVPEQTPDSQLCPLSAHDLHLSDITHLHFADVAAAAWHHAGLSPHDSRLKQTGVYVGHSGGTKSGGGLSLASQIEEAMTLLQLLPDFKGLSPTIQQTLISQTVAAIRETRPARHPDAIPNFHAYQAAALTARALGLRGPRNVIDAACASSLVALSQAMHAIRAGRIDSAIVGGATYNNIDNLILFSHSQACTASGSCPFDDRASGLVSSEGYVAIVITRQSLALKHDLPILCSIRGVGTASDGRGRSLWAPRKEGQILALRRAYADHTPLLDIDYLEAHATSTQLGDATELETLRHLSADAPGNLSGTIDNWPARLPIGSVKSNIGHTLEAAGLIGLVKILLAMQRQALPASLGFEVPNRNCDWSSAPFEVVRQNRPWSVRSAQPRNRRAAVSAFGIGGLNAHVVVEDYDSGRSVTSPPRSSTSAIATHQKSQFKNVGLRGTGDSAPAEPIVIAGRGVVVAGANNIQQFDKLMQSDRTAIATAPQARWLSNIGTGRHETPQSYKSPHCRGGFITDFKFDGTRYRIPPRQVQQANPLQMMLIDAVAQALADIQQQHHDAQTSQCRMTESIGNSNAAAIAAQDAAWPFSRQRTAVVVGTIFGGEFGDQLQVGMRLPEIGSHLKAAMIGQGITETEADRLCHEFRSCVLKHRPALLDETGSFTASTLASRIAKTFDLMGGAAAMDGDDASSMSALTFAIDQLRENVVDMVVCGTAQRSMNLAAFENLDMQGRLVRSGRTEDIPDDCQQILPGEGVASVLLCRLSDARRLGLRIYGTIQDLDHNLEQQDHARSVLTADDARIVRKIGYLSGSHSLVRIIAETLDCGKKHLPLNLFAKTKDCITYRMQFQSGDMQLQSGSTTSTESSVQASSSMMTVTTNPQDRPVTLRFFADSPDDLLRVLNQAVMNTAAEFAKQANSNTNSFGPSALFRVAVVAASADELLQRLPAVIKAVTAGRYRTLLDRERAVIWQRTEEPARVAWLFPGQGSHYSDSPSAFGHSTCARQMLNKIDSAYLSAGVPTLSSAFGNSAVQPGQNVWWAQAWVLGVSAALTEVLKAEGLRPDVVLGHSFGEFSASLASNVTTLAGTIELARHRANAVISHMRTPGRLLSVRASVHDVDALVKSAAIAVFVTHLNSPKQTVIAGGCQEISAAKRLLDEQGMPSLMIPVPAPFHTPLLADAEVAFDRMSAGVRLLPPTCGFLSATSAQYLSEPSAVRHSLVRQLTQPVMFMPSIERLANEGCRVFLEVGPNDVLTRLTRDIVGPQAISLSLDVPGQEFIERMALVKAVLQCVAAPSDQAAASKTGIDDSSFSHPETPSAGTPGNSPLNAASPFAKPASAPSDLVFDVTRHRRSEHAKTLPSSVNPQPEAHDSTRFHLPTPGQPAATQAAGNTSNPMRRSQFHEDDNLVVSGDADKASIPAQAAPLPTGHQSISLTSDDESTAFTEPQLRMFLRDLVVELTGYSPEIIDFSADLEADLGIDSIKKAQILGELGEWMGLSVRPESMRLDSVHSLDHAVATALNMAEQQGLKVAATDRTTSGAMQQVTGLEPSVRPHQTHQGALQKVAVQPQVSGAFPDPNPRGSRLSDSAAPAADQLDTLLIDYVVDQTGYDRDIVDIDADLEADLGLDSIKLAQLIGEMREQFDLQQLTMETVAQARFSTLRAVREFLLQLMDDGSAIQPANLSEHDAWKQQELASHFSPSNPAGDLRSLTAPQLEQRRQVAHGVAPVPVSVVSIPESTSTAALRGHDPVPFHSEGVRQLLVPDGQFSTTVDDAFQTGIAAGSQNRTTIRAALQNMVTSRGILPAEDVARHQLTHSTATEISSAHSSYLQGLALGAGVTETSVRLAAHLAVSKKAFNNSLEEPNQRLNSTDTIEGAASGSKTHRFALRVVPAPRRQGMPEIPKLHGPALILGDNPLTDALSKQIHAAGQPVHVIAVNSSMQQVEQTLSQLWQNTLTPHLFMTMAFDADSVCNIDASQWLNRRAAALEIPFRVCQMWMQRMIEINHMDKASVMAVTRHGGDFGFSGQAVESIEAIGGLVKAMLIECWMRGFRTTPMKVVDAAHDLPLAELAKGVMQELAVPSYDMEIALKRQSTSANDFQTTSVLSPERLSVQAIAAPLPNHGRHDASADSSRIQPGGTWLISGGGRGITAAVAMKLAEKYALNLQLLGTAPVPSISDEFVSQVHADRSKVRRKIMHEASARLENPVEAWRNTEKAIEIDATLRECRRRGISATYHCCDVGDIESVQRTVELIRQQFGPVRGVLHGAGAGQDARFDRKRPDKVEKCLKAKIDGAVALMRSTSNDPLQWFVAFGSISGRFGANGHTDYSLANDMMAKIVDRYRADRPEVRSLTFHWHAWGDIGMATKPEAKLALELIDMEFMPAEEGIGHFMRELEFGGDEPEVLITDETYFRKFFPAERLSVSSNQRTEADVPLIPQSATRRSDSIDSSVITLNPQTDKFLSQHLIQGRPTLPFAVALELMAEAVRIRTGHHPVRVVNAQALQAIRFMSDDSLAVTVQTSPSGEGFLQCRLLADVRRRDGRLVAEDREFFNAVFATYQASSRDTNQSAQTELNTQFRVPRELEWQRIEYGGTDGLIYHGPELQELREIADDHEYIWGRIAASAPVQLFGGSRARGFSIACATMDACLYAVGYAAWHRHHKPSLPVKFVNLTFGRLPDPGEPCVVRIKELQTSDSGATWSFQLQGHNGDCLMAVEEYRIGWITRNSSDNSR